MEVVWNIPYRCDLAPIEQVWGAAKRKFKAHVDRYKANNMPFDMEGLVQQILW